MTTDLDPADLDRLTDLRARHEAACYARPRNEALCQFLLAEIYAECDRIAAICALAKQVDELVATGASK